MGVRPPASRRLHIDTVDPSDATVAHPACNEIEIPRRQSDMRDAVRLEFLNNTVIGFRKDGNGQRRILRLNLGQNLQCPRARCATVITAKDPQLARL